MTPKNIAVLGAGLTGLIAAYRLTQRGHRVRVFEASGRAGGVIRTENADGWLSEAGPNSLLANDPASTALINELGLSPERLNASPLARHRYIVRHGRLVPLPLGPGALLRSPLLSARGKFRLLLDLTLRPRVRTADLSLADLIRGHFGSEAVDYLLNPFVAGIYAGNPQKLSARYAFPALWEAEQRHGSLLRAQRTWTQRRAAGGGIVSFARGLETLPMALAQRLPAGALQLRAKVEALLPGPPWSIVWSDGNETRTEHADAIVAALPAAGLAQLRFGTLGERPLASLDGIEHPPLSALFLGYRREQVRHPLDGFGCLVPEVERGAFLGVLFSSTLFPSRAPEGHVALTVMVGGTRQPDLARLGTAELLATVRPDLESLLGVQGDPVVTRHTFWPRAIPQYNLGHQSHLDVMLAAERAHRGLHIGGQCRDGIALPACITAGERLAAVV